MDFKTLRDANKLRLPLFRDSKGNLCHSRLDGSDWSVAEWLQALVGELGEFANVRKKYIRGDLTYEEYIGMAEKGLADVQTYLDILAFRAADTKDGKAHDYGFDLGQITRLKFNEVSARVGCPVFIRPDCRIVRSLD